MRQARSHLPLTWGLMLALLLLAPACDRLDGLTRPDQAAHKEHDDHDQHAGGGAGHEEEQELHLDTQTMADFGVELSVAGPASLVNILELPGEVLVDLDRQAHITPRIPGIVREVRVIVGDTVAAGELLAIIDSHDISLLRIAHREAHIELDEAAAELHAREVEVGKAGLERELAEAELPVLERRLELAAEVVRQRELQLGWQQQVHTDTATLLALIHDGEPIGAIIERLSDSPTIVSRAELLSACAMVEVARANLERVRNLQGEGIRSEATLQQAEGEYLTARVTFAALAKEADYSRGIELMEAEIALSGARQARLQAERDVASARRSLELLAQEHQVAAANVRIWQQHRERIRSHIWATERQLLILGVPSGELEALESIEPANVDISRYELRAPCDGAVIDKHLTVGEFVSAEEPVFTVAALDRVWIDLRLFPEQAELLVPDQAVGLSSRSGPTQQARIERLMPLVDPHTRTITARVLATNEQNRWRPGMFVTGRVTTAPVEVAIGIPMSALVELEGRTVVFVRTDDGALAPQEIELGRSDGQWVEVLAGLSAGTSYVGSGAFTLKAQLQRSSFGDGHAH